MLMSSRTCPSQLGIIQPVAHNLISHSSDISQSPVSPSSNVHSYTSLQLPYPQTPLTLTPPHHESFQDILATETCTVHFFLSQSLSFHPSIMSPAHGIHQLSTFPTPPPPPPLHLIFLSSSLHSTTQTLWAKVYMVYQSCCHYPWGFPHTYFSWVPHLEF